MRYITVWTGIMPSLLPQKLIRSSLHFLGHVDSLASVKRSDPRNHAPSVFFGPLSFVRRSQIYDSTPQLLRRSAESTIEDSQAKD